jgi:cellulose synthase/poly-beta-1,6-N-acetylglucosamine synthase-like glycosyltransferase
VLNSFYSFWDVCVNLLELICLPLSLVSISALLFYYFYFFIKLYLYKSTESSFSHPVSIIVCAKNELNNLRKKLPLILEQNYFNFEVIVVNDHSSDESKFFLDELVKLNKHLVVVDIDEFVNEKIGKKFALTLGIKTAKHDHILLTDADCMPYSKDWVKQMSSNFNNAEIILGYGSYDKKGGLLNKIIRFDTFNVAQQYLSFALAGATYMGVGRNLAYKKSLFFDNKGFASHIHIASGDDDLFIQEIAPKGTVAIEISENAHTTSEVTDSWKDWIHQKRRHLSAAPLYSAKFKILLALYPLAQFLFISSIFLLVIFSVDVLYIIMLLSLRLLVSYVLNYKTMKRLNVYDLYWIHPLYELLHLIIQLIFVLLNVFVKPKKWSR